MARFAFQLQGVLTHRKHQEQERQRRVALIVAQINGLEAQLRALQQTVQQATDDLRSRHLVGAIDLNYLAAHRRFIGATQRQGMMLVQKIALAQRQLLDAQKELAEAAKARKIIEKLRERQENRWKIEHGRIERFETDEIATQLTHAALAETSV